MPRRANYPVGSNVTQIAPMQNGIKYQPTTGAMQARGIDADELKVQQWPVKFPAALSSTSVVERSSQSRSSEGCGGVKAASVCKTLEPMSRVALLANSVGNRRHTISWRSLLTRLNSRGPLQRTIESQRGPSFSVLTCEPRLHS